MIGALLQSITRPDEIQAMFAVKFGGATPKARKGDLAMLAQDSQLTDNSYCYEVLNRVSRSFAVVIQQLPEELRDAVCLFYLILRGLDTVEDDMTFANEQKIPMLLDFHNIIGQTGWSLEGVGDSDAYRTLLKYFPRVLREYAKLSAPYQAVIRDITRRMGAGMASYADKSGSIDTCESYDLYCHYVAGLVGHGLSALFSASGLEKQDLASREGLRVSNAMGLFLQKTNIIRDYLEDMEEGRTWWPKEVWSKHANTLEHFATHPNSPEAVACLNEMVTNALTHVPDCLAYLRLIRDPQVFAFCAIPQVMAIETLRKVYNNPLVFTSVQKVRKGRSCVLMLNTKNMADVRGVFGECLADLRSSIPAVDPSADRTRELADRALRLCQQQRQQRLTTPELLDRPTTPELLARPGLKGGRGEASEKKHLDTSELPDLVSSTKEETSPYGGFVMLVQLLLLAFVARIVASAMS